MTIPEARRRLMNLAATLSPEAAAEIATIVREGLFRRRGITPTPPKSKRMCRKVGSDIRALHKQRPDLSEQEIAVKIGVNSGRVSEALIGKRV